LLWAQSQSARPPNAARSQVAPALPSLVKAAMTSSDEESSVCCRPLNKLVLQFSAPQGGAATSLFQNVTAAYEGDDTYSVLATGSNGQPFEVEFLSRAATAEFLQRMLGPDHDVSVTSKDGAFAMPLPDAEDRSYRSLMHHLLLLRDSRGLVVG